METNFSSRLEFAWTNLVKLQVVVVEEWAHAYYADSCTKKNNRPFLTPIKKRTPWLYHIQLLVSQARSLCFLASFYYAMSL